MLYCTQCRAQLTEGTRFCGACGTSVPEHATSPTPPAANASGGGVWDMADPERVSHIPGLPRRRLLGILLLVGAALVVLAGVAAGLWIWLGTGGGEDAPVTDEEGAERGFASDGEAVMHALSACRAQDGAAMWAAMSDGFRAESEQAALRWAASFTPQQLAEALGYEGTIDRIDGQNLLTVTMHGATEPDNPCWRAAEWTELARDGDASHTAVLYAMPSGNGRGIMVERFGDRWLVAKITQTLLPEEFPAFAPSYVPPAEPEPVAGAVDPVEPPAATGAGTWREVCDEYERRACSCADQPGLCASARRQLQQMRRMARRRAMRDFVKQGCLNSLASIANACP